MGLSNAVSVLRVHDLSLNVNLGVRAEERAVPQEVRVSLELRFASPPMAEQTDELADAICYSALCKHLRRVASAKEYGLIEHLAAASLEVLQTHLEGRATIALKLQKVRPPIEGLLGGTSYTTGDFLI